MKTTRRTLLGHATVAPLGLLLPTGAIGCATKSLDPSTRPESAASGTTAIAQFAPAPLPFDATALPGLSEKLLRSHHENNYTGAVKKLNAARAQLQALPADAPGFVLGGLAKSELAFKHSVALHELYFGNLTGGGSQGSTTRKMLADHFGGDVAWEARFRALGKSLGGGSGWAILEFDLQEMAPRMYIAGDHTQGLSTGIPLLVLDMYEHSYHMDYGTAAARYIDAFFANVHWEEVDRRTEQAQKIVALLS